MQGDSTRVLLDGDEGEEQHMLMKDSAVAGQRRGRRYHSGGGTCTSRRRSSIRRLSRGMRNMFRGIRQICVDAITTSRTGTFPCDFSSSYNYDNIMSYLYYCNGNMIRHNHTTSKNDTTKNKKNTNTPHRFFTLLTFFPLYILFRTCKYFYRVKQKILFKTVTDEVGTTVCYDSKYK